ncbi:PAP/OAS1 substrate-binding domain superfamily [Rhynchospora pubera]|uniref:PAP/OAS1 substrate-binding domain superfamily n=1 Tax=Rhynchospora pubera TaxID=906938 RepID=A0AAV8F775_9POAL|nr:PAP/OAS1 substrate-binding domain superfamily [Rhynchospora pubera]
MGDLEPWPGHANGILSEPNPESLLNPYPPNPDLTTIDEATWQRAEEAAQEVLRHIHPTVASEKSRMAVVEYVDHIITKYIGTVVSPFGSVPLKTYLPDGDIDLTALVEPNSEHLLPEDVWSVLDMEEKNPYAKFEVKDVQLVLAEVKLVKCLVQNIVVDISFNQVGGLFTLCFLEEVDLLIGKDHLFKRSIMLIKSWCYYESRILGAHHGLISTYALETLILYIFHLFHKTLDSPLAVLYRFLDYYSKFDWDNQGISVHGPISLASLPEIAAEAPEIPASDLLIQEDFVNRCLDRYQVKIPNKPNDIRGFFRKNLNIVDPLKPTNNLGRSVSRGNFYRIRSAFVFGARKLGQILSLPAGSIPDEVNTFFRNTLERHGSGGPRPDVPDQTSNSPYVDLEASIAQMSMHYPNGHIPNYRPVAYPHNLSPHMFVHEENVQRLGGSEPDSSETPSDSPSEEHPELDGFADITGNGDLNVKNLFFALTLFENKQPESFMLPGQPAGPDSSPVVAIPYRPFMGGRYGRRGMHGYAGVNGFMPGSHFASPVGYYVLRSPFIPPSGQYGTDESPKTRGTGTYLPLSHQRQDHQQQQQFRGRIHPRGKPRNMVRPDQGGSIPELFPSEESILDSTSTPVHRPPPPPPPLHIPYRVPNGRWAPVSPVMGVQQSQQLGIRGNRGRNSRPLFSQEQQVEFGSLGSVVLHPNDPNYTVGMQSPAPPPPVPAVTQIGQRSSNVGSAFGHRPVPPNNRSRRINQTYRLKDEEDFPPLSG